MKILVINEDPAMTDLLQTLLRPSLFEVMTASTTQDGITLAQLFKPDIILLDLTITEIHGWKACKALRKFSTAAIVILSALDNPSLVADALDAGADDYLIKPVPNRVLTAHIENLARRKRVEQMASLSVST